MNVIFLDFDGVIVTRRQLRKPQPDSAARALDALIAAKADPDCVAALNRLCEETGAKIVVTSSWRRLAGFVDPLEYVREVLRLWGVRAEVIDVTPMLERELMVMTDDGQRVPMTLPKERGHEIQAWLDGNPGVARFVILDDEDDMVHLRPRLVRTDFEDGLQMRHVEKAVSILRI
jgi:hypothetical protein